MKIALTFDDGPNEPYTRQILEVLAEFGVKATFFVIGKWVRKEPWIVRMACRCGARGRKSQ
jgi:peptidoglycan/xylan/chitin deacetylase (PgdA/CDA1 family)